MINFADIVFPVLKTMWPLLLIVGVIGIIVAVVAIRQAISEDSNVDEEAPFVKKPYVFDAMSELSLYRILNELFGDKYYIFPQVGYSHLIDLKPGTERRHRTRFDKKSADFVLCDKERAIARLVIELDGRSHLSHQRIDRDEKVDRWMRLIGLPILHLNPERMDRAFIQSQILDILDGDKR